MTGDVEAPVDENEVVIAAAEEPSARHGAEHAEKDVRVAETIECIDLIADLELLIADARCGERGHRRDLVAVDVPAGSCSRGAIARAVATTESIVSVVDVPLHENEIALATQKVLTADDRAEIAGENLRVAVGVVHRRHDDVAGQVFRDADAFRAVDVGARDIPAGARRSGGCRTGARAAAIVAVVESRPRDENPSAAGLAADRGANHAGHELRIAARIVDREHDRIALVVLASAHARDRATEKFVALSTSAHVIAEVRIESDRLGGAGSGHL